MIYKLFNTKILFLFCTISTIISLTSCDKNDDDVSSGAVELLSFGPTGSKHGDTIRFVGKNLNQVTAIQFTGENAVVEKAGFASQTNELILVVVPDAAEKGYVTLKTSNGEIVSKTQFNLNVLVNIDEMPAEARPGENITLKGSYLNWVKSITFEKDLVIENFVSQSFNELVVTVPEEASTGPLIIYYMGTDSADIQTDDTLKVTLPVAANYAPNPIKPGADLTITGTDLDLVKQIIFDGVDAVTLFESQAADKLVVKVPATAKTGTLKLIAASGVESIAETDLEIILPQITSFSPNPINLGAALKITGTDLDLVNKVIFSGVAGSVSTFTAQSATELTLPVPAGARDGIITLEAASGIQTHSASGIDITLPFITTMSPDPVDPGSNLTITGTNLNMVTSVTFSNAPAVNSFVSKTATQIVVKVPNGVLRGPVTLGISAPADTVQSSTQLEIGGALPPPTIDFPIYDDAVTANWTNTGWIGGGWGGNANYGAATPVREGSKSIQVNYVGGWGSPVQLGHGDGASISVGTYTTFKVSIFGAPGSGGKKVNVGINGADKYDIVIEEGKWTDYSIPITSLTTTGKISAIIFKEYNGTGGFTIYLDAIGLN